MFRFAIRSTASEPQVLHRPWLSSAICVRQLTHHQCLSMDCGAGLPPLGWWNMFSLGSNAWAKTACRAAFPGRLCSDGHKRPLRKRKTYPGPNASVLKVGFAMSCRRTGNSK
jgi:hypothetical protein